MKTYTETERSELEAVIQVKGNAGVFFKNPLPELFINTHVNSHVKNLIGIAAKGGNPSLQLYISEFLLGSASIMTDRVVCGCPFQPHVDWAVFASREGRSHLLHRFRLN